MEYTSPTKFLNINDYEYIVSIGNKCPTAMILKKLNVYKESFPFDFIPICPFLINKYLKSQEEFYPKKNLVRNDDGVWFGHFDIDKNYTETIETFKRRFERLFNILQNKKKILFVYSSEADIYNEGNNRYNNNYEEIQKMVDYIINTFNYNDFKILCIHTNKSFMDTNNISNYTINVPFEFLSDDGSTHDEKTTTTYRSVLYNLCKEIFKI